MKVIDMHSNEGSHSIKIELYRDYVKMYKPMIADIMLKQNWNNRNIIDENDINDVLQETILLFLEKRMQYGFQLTSKESTFIYGLAINKAREYLRKKRKIETLNSDDFEIEDVVESEFNQEMINLLKLCIELLKGNKREIMRLQYTENESMKNIAKILGLSDDNVAKALSYRAKQEIKKCIQSKQI